MMITHKITMDLADPKSIPTIDAVQNDQYARDLEITLLCAGEVWKPPDGTSVVVRYIKSDGCGGEYDLLPDGSAAWAISGNLVTAALAPQMLSAAGLVHVNVGLIQGITEINTFQILIDVHRNVGAELAASEDYWSRSGLLPTPASARIGQYIRVEETDPTGIVSATVAADPVISDLSQNDPAAEDYVKGRTHWKETLSVPLDIQWDGLPGDRLIASGNGLTFVKVSDLILSDDELRCCWLQLTYSSSGATVPYDLSGFDESDFYRYGENVIHSYGVGIVRDTTVNFGTADTPAYAPETGIYFVIDPQFHVSRLYSDTVTTSSVVYHELPEAYLPARTRLPEVTADDVRKVLAVDDQGRWVAAVNPGVVMLTQAEYDGLAGDGMVIDDVLYIIEG